MVAQNKKTIVITGGGTGGHIYPGLAIAQALEDLDPDVKIAFVGAKGGMEEKIFPRYPYEHHFIPIGRFHSSVGLWQQIKTLIGFPLALFKAVLIFCKLRPTTVLGVGGFASGPFVVISALFGADTYLWEANAFPGLTNRWLSRFVRGTFIVFEEARKYLKSSKILFSGMPVRQEFFASNDKFEGPAGGGKLRVLLFGGSQGARFINEVFLAMLNEFPQILQKIEVVHQIGSRDYGVMIKKYGDLAQKVKVLEYIHDMPKELHAADFVICRSGASTVAEVVSCRKPALFIPLPTAADNHQFHNAQVIGEKKGAFVIEQKDLTAEKLERLLESLHEHPQMLIDMSSRLNDFQFQKASLTVAQSLLKGS